MKPHGSSTTLFLALFSSWSVIGSFAIRSSNKLGANGFVNKEERLHEEDDDRLRFHMMIKEEGKNKPVVASRRVLMKAEKDKMFSAKNESILADRIMKSLPTMNTDANLRDLQSNCDSEINIFQECLQSDFNCNFTCVIEAEDKLFKDNNGSVSCPLYNAEICPSFDTCGCEMCKWDYSVYYNCASTSLCTLNCGSTSSPTPAPTQAVICPEELERVAACVQNMDSCVTCVTDAFDSINENADNICAAIATGICPAIKTDCGCEECSVLLEEYYSCAFIEYCPALDCNLGPTESTPSPTKAPPSPAAPDTEMSDAPRSADIQSSEDGSGISIGVIIGAIGGIVGVVGIIIGAVLYSRRNVSNSTSHKPVVNEILNTTHDDTENNPPSTPGRHSEYDVSPGSPAHAISSLTFRNSQSTSTSPNTNNLNQRPTPTPKYKEPDDGPQGDSYNPQIPHQPSASYNSEYQQHRPSQQYPPQHKDIRSSYSAHSSSTSHTAQSRQSHRQQQSPPPTPTPAYMPTTKDQCRSVMRGGEEDMVVVATPVVMVESTPMVTDAQSATSNTVNSSSNDSKPRRQALDP